MSNKLKEYCQDILKKSVECEYSKLKQEINLLFKASKLRNIDNLSGLFHVIPHLTSNQKRLAIWLLGRLKNRKAVPVLLTLLEDKRNDPWGICDSLALLGGNKAITGLLAKLKRETNANIREAIVYSLSFVFDTKVAAALMSLASNKKEISKIRAQATEGLGYFLGSVKGRSSIYKKGFDCLTRLSNEKDINIRFYASFSLRNLKARISGQNNSPKGRG